MKNAVKINSVHFTYKENREILKGVSATLEEGKLHALFGPNGSGKSTLLKCLTGLLEYNSGEVEIMGKDIKCLNNKELSKIVSYVPQEHRMTFPFTVEEVVLMGRTPHLGGFIGPKQEDIDYVEKAIKIIGIDDIAQRPYTELSGGQRQLVLLARAMAQDTPVMVLDEPTSALDFKNQVKVWGILKRLKDYGKTVIACTHDPNHVTWFCDSTVILKDGIIIKQGDVKKVMNNETLKVLYGGICEIDENGVRPCFS